MAEKGAPPPGKGGTGKKDGKSPGKLIVYEADTRLKDKVGTGRGKTREEMIAEADTLVSGMKAQYLAQLDTAINEMRRLSTALASGNGDRGETLSALYRIAHDQRGLGGTFDYRLITQICDSLCGLIDRADPDHPKLAAAVETHLNGLLYVYGHHVEGDAEPGGRKLIGQLWRVTEAVGGPTPEPPTLAGGNAPELDDVLTDWDKHGSR